MSSVLKIYQRMEGIPYGKRICSRLLTFKVPYFASIRPEVKKFDVGLCEVEMKDRRAVRNHLGTVHAIAMCNICELAMGLAAESAIPADLRWIPKGMQIDYIKKARGTLLGICRIDPSTIAPGEFSVPISIKDKEGDDVARASIMLHITEKPETGE